MEDTIHRKAGYVRDAVFGANDGVVTTFAVVAGSAGAVLGFSVVLILGFANLFADGFSMAAGNYLGVKSGMEYEESSGIKKVGKDYPMAHAGVTFLAFNMAGFVPLIPYVFKMESAFLWSGVFVAITFFILGVLKSIYTKKNLFVSGLEVFLVGGVASGVAYAVGYLLHKYVV